MDPEASWCGIRTYNNNNYQMLDSLNENAFTKMRVLKWALILDIPLHLKLL